jgi:hypothetical protein
MEPECELVDRLIQKMAQEDWTEGTKQRLVIDATQFCRWYRGTYGEDPDPDDLALNDFKVYLLQRCHANTTERKLASLRAALKLIAIDVLTKLRFPKVPQAPKPSPSVSPARSDSPSSGPRTALARGIEP